MGGIQRTVDIFREPVVKEDDASVKRGFLATILYAVTLAVAFIVIAVFLFQQERTYQVKVSNPTLQEFLDVESLSPTCSCSKSLIQVKDVPSLANFLDHRSSDLCSPSGMGTCSLIADAFLNVNETALEAAMTSDTDAQELGVWVRDVLGSADGYCYTISNSVGRIRSSLEATGIGAGTLLARTEFTDAMVSSVRVAFIDLSNIFSSTDTTLRNAAAAGNVQQYASIRDFGALSGATNHRPANCTCSGSNAMPFRKFDLQIGGQSHDAGCSIPATVHGLMAHALDTTLYDADYGIFTSEASKATGDGFDVHDGSLHGYLIKCDLEFFELYVDANLTLPSEAFGEYFDQCGPTECNYVEIRRPSATELITLTLGLLGGLVTVIRAVVGAVGKKLIAERKTSVASRARNDAAP